MIVANYKRRIAYPGKSEMEYNTIENDFRQIKSLFLEVGNRLWG